VIGEPGRRVTAARALLLRQQLLEEGVHPAWTDSGSHDVVEAPLVGLHFVHVAVGGLLALWALARTWRFDRTAIVTVRVTALYWYFLAVVAAVVFLTLYLSPRG